VAQVLDLYNGNNVTIVERKTRVKRTESQMLESVAGDPLSEAHYLKARLIKLEEKMADLMSKASSQAVELVLQGNEHFRRYLP
jgi:hypothetical protein